MLKVLHTDLSSLLIRLYFFTTFHKINRQAVYEQSSPALGNGRRSFYVPTTKQKFSLLIYSHFTKELVERIS